MIKFKNMDVRVVKKLLKNYGVYPSKRLGQNFLIDKNFLGKIIKAANLSKKDTVLEIGSGIGNLTLELSKKVREVIAVEKDEKMCQILKELLVKEGIKNVKIINKDILKISSKDRLSSTDYKLVANLPYYITSPVIRKFLELKNPPQLMVLMIQKEVAKRICQKPPKMTLLSVSVQFYAQPKIISLVSKSCFWPSPKVDSAIIKIVPFSKKDLGMKKNMILSFFKIIRAGFSQPRKQLVNNLSWQLKKDKEKVKKWLLENHIKPNQRAESLSIENWKKLTKSLKI